MTATTQFVIWKQFLKVATLTLSPHDVFCEYVALEDHFWHKWQNKCLQIDQRMSNSSKFVRISAVCLIH